MFSLLRREPQVSPSSYDQNHTPVPALTKRKSEADVIKALHAESRAQQLEKENVGFGKASGANGRPALKSITDVVNNTTKAVSFEDEPGRQPHRGEAVIHAMELLHYTFHELRVMRKPLPVDELFKTLTYFFPSLKLFIENMPLASSGDNNDTFELTSHAMKLAELWADYSDIIVVDVIKHTVTIHPSAFQHLDMVSDRVSEVMQETAKEIVVKVLEQNGGSVKRAALKKAVNAKFQYICSRIISRSSFFEQLAASSPNVILYQDFVVLKGVGKIPAASNEASATAFSRAKSLSQLPRDDRRHSTSLHDQRHQRTFDRRVSTFEGPRATPLSTFAETAPKSAPPLLKMVRSTPVPVKVPEKPAFEKYTGIAPVGVVASDTPRLRAPKTTRRPEAEKQRWQAFSTNKPKVKVPVTPSQTVLGHENCMCNEDLEKIYKACGELAYNDFASKHLHCLIAVTKKRFGQPPKIYVDAQVATDVQIPTDIEV